MDKDIYNVYLGLLFVFLFYLGIFLILKNINSRHTLNLRSGFALL